MLWYKSFRELRTVTLVGAAAMAAACLFVVFYQQPMRATADVPMTYIAYIWKSIYNSLGTDMFLILSVILGSGGLLQERAQGTSGFTLALPVSRRHIVITRAVMGYCSVLIIAAVPIFAVPMASHFIGEYYPVAQTCGFFALWAAGGAVFYGLTFLLAHRLEGDYIAVLVAIPSFMLYGALLNLPWLARLPMLNIFHVINGEDMPFFNEAQHLLAAPLPLLTLTVMFAVSATFILLAARRIEPLDF
ncbi:hypothetical protein [Terriglobus albidus]|uniref:hypothetical protein n=1 Tax=Terriglobus albidus TaxID=1592106 RepID=UPI0021DFC3E2|nr:hypothetical protein [Terriglobus albidus]